MWPWFWRMIAFQRWFMVGTRRRISRPPAALRRFSNASSAPSWMVGVGESSAASSTRRAASFSVFVKSRNVVAMPDKTHSSEYALYPRFSASAAGKVILHLISSAQFARITQAERCEELASTLACCSPAGDNQSLRKRYNSDFRKGFAARGSVALGRTAKSVSMSFMGGRDSSAIGAA